MPLGTENNGSTQRRRRSVRVRTAWLKRRRGITNVGDGTGAYMCDIVSNDKYNCNNAYHNAMYCVIGIIV